MQERDLIVAVLAAQAGFVTPSEVLAAAAAGLVDAAPDSLLTRLENSGALNMERRRALEALTEQALAARNGDARGVLTSMGASARAIETLVSAVPGVTGTTESHPDAGVAVPLERPGQYTRLGELGRGGQSVVRVARDEIVGREVALKELVATALPANDDSSRAARARFLREVRLVAGLDHPGIVAIHELARREDGTLFCAQKLVRGENLQSRIATCRSLAGRLGLVRHVLDACLAMGFAHAKHVVHRDLKPSNVMVGEYGETVVVDWGLAKRQDEAEEVVPPVLASAEPSLTVAGVALGTPAYTSPEQARGDLPSIDARSDVFSLGAILYQVLTGRPPFEGVSSEHVLENVRAGRFSPVLTMSPGAPPELAAIAEHALRPEPSQRYQNAQELARELSAYLAGGRVRAYQYGAWELLRKFASSHRALTAGVVVALGALVLSAVVVGVRLQVVRRDLARSFIERARAAERESDWALASAYFAAARAQRDTPEARWGVALAGERAIEHVFARQGAPGSFADVDVLPDGRVVVLGVTGSKLEVRELEEGRVLWSRNAGQLANAVFYAGSQVGVVVRSGFAFFDTASGRLLATLEPENDGRPCPGPFPTPVIVAGQQLIARRQGQPSRILASAVTSFHPWCTVSGDGLQVAYADSSGGVHLLAVADGRKLAEGSGAGLRNLIFSSHGLVVVRQGWLDVLGGPEGGFSIPLAEPAYGAQIGKFGGVAVSPDGHRVVVARIGSHRADLVDLRARTILGTIHHVAGWPRFAFSQDGRRVYAAGLGGESRVDAWDLPPDDAPTGHPGRWPFWSINFSPSGRQLAIVDGSKPAVELHGADGELLARSPVSSSVRGAALVRDGVVLLADWAANQVSLRDVEHGRDLWTRRCRICPRFQASADGSRVALLGLDGLEVWEARTDRVFFAETRRWNGVLQTAVSLSPDGRRVAWTEGSAAHLREVDSGEERTFPLDGPATLVSFSPDSRRLAVITSASLSLWDAAGTGALWAVSHTTPEHPFEPRWSTDGAALLVQYGLGTEVLDTRSGARLARFPANGVSASVLRPDLRAKLVATESNWDLRPLPPPVTDSPADGLQRTLRRTGLALEGVEVVAGP